MPNSVLSADYHTYIACVCSVHRQEERYAKSRADYVQFGEDKKRQQLTYNEEQIHKYRRSATTRVVFVGGGSRGTSPSLDLTFPPTGLSENFPARERVIPRHC